jgi:hypothetical protein
MNPTRNRYERVWGTALIAVGVVLLGAVFLAAFVVAVNPGDYYDRWVPADETAGPEAAFEWSASGLVVEFTDTSEFGDAAVERWVWDFDTGVESADPNPTYSFTEEGEFAVTLEVVDDNGLSSKAEATVEVQLGADGSGDGAIGLSDMADKLIDTVETTSKGGFVVVLVIGMFVVLTLIGGRLVSQGVRILRPVPKRINMKLRPKELELAVLESTSDRGAASDLAAVEPELETEDVAEHLGAGV